MKLETDETGNITETGDKGKHTTKIDTSTVSIVFAVLVIGFVGIVSIIAKLVLIFILTVYIITFGYGLFVDPSLFATQSIFTIPFFDVVRIGMSNIWLFILTYVLMLVRDFEKYSQRKKNECALHR